MRAELILALMLAPAPAAAQSFFQSSSCKLEQMEGGKARLVQEGREPVALKLANDPLVHYVSEQCGLAALSGVFAGDRMVFNTVDIYSSTGALLGSNRVAMENMGGAGFDSEGRLFLYAYQSYGKGGISLFSMETGVKLWALQLPGEAMEVKLSDDGKRILALAERPREKKTRNYRAAMFSAEGKELWRDDFSSPYSLGVESFDPDLRRFVLRLRTIRLGVPDGIKMRQLRKYRWDGSRLSKEIVDYSADEHKPVEKKKRAKNDKDKAGPDLHLPDAAPEPGQETEHGHR